MLADFLARDYFSHSLHLNVDRKEPYSMWLGKAVTMLINVLVIIFAIYESQKFRSLESALVSEHVEPADFDLIGRLNLKDANFMPFIQVFDKLTRQPLIYDEQFFQRYFSIRLQQITVSSLHKPQDWILDNKAPAIEDPRHCTQDDFSS